MNDQTLTDLKAALEKRAESWRTNPDDSHGIDTAVYVVLLEVAQAIADALAAATVARTGADGRGEVL